MKKIKSIFYILVVILLMVSACKKKEDPIEVSKESAGYDEIIDSLTIGQAYALVESVSYGPILFVAHDAYDYGDGIMAAIDADVYYRNYQGNIVFAGNIQCDGTAYPIATTDQFIWMGGGHHISKLYIDESTDKLTTSIEATEIFDTEGNATYYNYSEDDSSDENIEDDSLFLSLFDEYVSNGCVTNFTLIE